MPTAKQQPTVTERIGVSRRIEQETQAQARQMSEKFEMLGWISLAYGAAQAFGGILAGVSGEYPASIVIPAILVGFGFVGEGIALLRKHHPGMLLLNGRYSGYWHFSVWAVGYRA